MRRLEAGLKAPGKVLAPHRRPWPFGFSLIRGGLGPWDFFPLAQPRPHTLPRGGHELLVILLLHELDPHVVELPERQMLKGTDLKFARLLQMLLAKVGPDGEIGDVMLIRALLLVARPN